MIWIDFDDIWQKYSKVSRIEFACFRFHIGLLVITLLSLKLHTENNECMLCTSVSSWARLFLQHLSRRSLWIICETDDRWIPRLTWNFSDCSVALRFVFRTQQQRLNCVDVFISMRTCAVLRLLLPERLSTVPNFTSSLLMLFFGQPLVRNSVINCYNLYILADFWLKFCLLCWVASKLPRLLDTVSKFALFSVSDLKDEKLMKTETCKLYSRDFWIFLPNVIKIDPCLFELHRFKVGPFFETQCILRSAKESYIIAYRTPWLCTASRANALIILKVIGSYGGQRIRFPLCR